MSSGISGVFENSLASKIADSKILVVGAGGIGCELLKNLVLTGFNNIEIIDLDTIDVTNLNRQFLFQKQHVGKSKSVVAKESALRFNPNVNIISHHDSVMNSEYGVSYFKKFALVLNALDNRAARNHVNRMCLASNIPLVESGSAGYFGQVTVIKKGLTECYECQPKPRQKTYPGCTIRNTPSEPIHCIVWAKHLFNQLFGEADADEDVSPDTEDPEAAGDTAGEKALEKEAEEDGNVNRTSTRQWAQESDYNPKKLFTKLFNDDIKYLLSMEKLWQKRRKPVPLDWDNLPKDDSPAETTAPGGIKDQTLWNIKDCCNHLENSITQLKEKFKALKEGDHLVWDKDDDDAMDFVTACANIRAYIFNIPRKSRFDVKSMAGNIIPAIATTNAIIAGCIVMEAIKILNDDVDSCKTVYLTRKPNPRKKILVPCQLIKPNPKCYVCSEKPEVSVRLNLETMTVKNFEERVLKGALNMVAPDAEIEGRGLILISSEEGETECNDDKTLKSFDLSDGSILSVDDFMQEYNLKVFLYHCDKLEDGVDFELVGDMSQVKQQKEENKDEKNGKNGEEASTSGTSSAPVPSTSTAGMTNVNDSDEEEDDDVVMILPSSDRKRSGSSDFDETTPTSKRLRVEKKGEPVKKKRSRQEETKDLDDVVCID